MKEWTLETLISQLRNKVMAAGYGDILDDMGEVWDWTVGQLIERLKDEDFKKRMSVIDGQQAIYVDALGNVSTGDAVKPKTEKDSE